MLDLVATAVEAQGQGHCKALLQGLEGWLGPQLGVASLVAVCPADVSGTCCPALHLLIDTVYGMTDNNLVGTLCWIVCAAEQAVGLKTCHTGQVLSGG